MGKKKLRKWFISVIESVEGEINKDSFINALIEKGKITTNQNTKDKMRSVYSKLKTDPEYWENVVKKRIIIAKSWEVFSPHERSDRPPPQIFSKKRNAFCYKCSGSLYSDMHESCQKCGWIICPYDKSCGCGFGYKFARVDFKNK